MSEREDPYYPPQDPLWTKFEIFLFSHLNWKRHWNFMESKDIWWKYWLAFKSGAYSEVV